MNIRHKFLVLLISGLGAPLTLPGQIMETPDYVPLKVDQTEVPVFPSSLLPLGVKEGVVRLTVAVDAVGHLADYLVTMYTHPAFADNAVAAIKHWRFEPTLVHGNGRNATADFTFTFQAEGVVVVTMDISSYPELIHLKLAPDSMAFHSYPLGQLDRIPTPLKVLKPNYRPSSARSKRGGHVTVDFYIDQQGHVRIPAVSRETNEANEELAAIAVTAVSDWQFEPPLVKGKPVLVFAQQDFDFKPLKP